jgi:hypothetical protein
MAAAASGPSFSSSTRVRVRQKRSRPASISSVISGPIGSTLAPAAPSARAAPSTAARVSGSTGSLAAPSLSGNEGVAGSSPAEGFTKRSR